MRVLAVLLMVLAGLTEEDWNRYFEGEREEMLARMPRESVARPPQSFRSSAGGPPRKLHNSSDPFRSLVTVK